VAHLRLLRICLAVVVVGLISSAPASAQPAATPASSPSTRPAPKPRTPDDAVTPQVKSPGTEGFLRRHEQFLKRKAEGPIDLLFIGDSITDFWPRRGKDSWQKFEEKYHPADFGISGDRTEHVLWRLDNGEIDGITPNPKVVVIMIGTNNIGHFPDEKPAWAAAGIIKIVQTVRTKLPDSKILLLGVFPRDTKDSPRREKVKQINDIISKLDDGGRHVKYLDIGDKFLDSNGEIPQDVMRDKLHPTTQGYDIWYGAIEPTLDELMKG
jgi:lysophospholipase L1-like esterase